MAKGDLLPDFVAAIRGEHEPLVTGEDVVRVMRICLAAWESADRGCAIQVA